MSDQNPFHEDISSSPEGGTAPHYGDRPASMKAATSDHDDDNAATDGTSMMQALEDSLQRGAAFARENPLVTAVGVASVAALVVMASRKASTPESSLTRLERDLRNALSNAPSNVNSAVDSITGAVTRALSADPKNTEALQSAASHWLQQAQSALKSYIPDTLSKR